MSGDETSFGEQPLEAGERAVAWAVGWLDDGGLLVHPTSTVYGIGGPPEPGADRAINRLKGRPPERPLLRLAASAEQVRSLRPEVVWSERAERLAARFWPGGLTLVLDDGSARGLAVRVDGHPAARRIPGRWGRLMSSTSLNPSGGTPLREPEEARKLARSWSAPEHPVGFLDGGELPASEPSTMVSLRKNPPVLLREGALPREAVEGCLDLRIEEAG